MRLCQDPVSQRPPHAVASIPASLLRLLPPGSSHCKFLLSHSSYVHHLAFLKGNSSCLLLYLFLIVYFYQHAPMDIYFIPWVVAIEASTLSCYSISSGFGHWMCSQVASVLSQRPSTCYFSLRLEYFLNSGTTKCSCSSCTFLAPILEAAMSPGNCSSVLWFTGKWYLWYKNAV